MVTAMASKHSLQIADLQQCILSLLECSSTKSAPDGWPWCTRHQRCWASRRTGCACAHLSSRSAGRNSSRSASMPTAMPPFLHRPSRAPGLLVTCGAGTSISAGRRSMVGLCTAAWASHGSS